MEQLKDKECYVCHKTKLIGEFYKRNNRKIGIRSECKDCTKKLAVQYKKENIDKYREWRNKATKKWFSNNKQRVYEYRKKIRNTDGKIKLIWNTRTALSGLLRKRLSKRKDFNIKWEKLVGYKFKDLITHLEKQFDKNMNWNNYGNYWEVDHIKPISLFIFNNEKDKEFKGCWALSNLQPLEKSFNRKKYNKYE